MLGINQNPQDFQGRRDRVVHACSQGDHTPWNELMTRSFYDRAQTLFLYAQEATRLGHKQLAKDFGEEAEHFASAAKEQLEGIAENTWYFWRRQFIG
jgi:hypothetical protein